jgi:hypothetical protein
MLLLLPSLLLLPALLLLQDVLGHPHTKAFVSHCGMHSVNEAAFHGVPLVALPFQMEQVRTLPTYLQPLLTTSPCSRC